MAIGAQGLDSAVLYAFLRLRDETTVLKYAKKASMKHLCWLLMCFGKCYEVIAYICGVKMVLRQQHSSSDKRWGQKAWAKS